MVSEFQVPVFSVHSVFPSIILTIELITALNNFYTLKGDIKWPSKPSVIKLKTLTNGKIFTTILSQSEKNIKYLSTLLYNLLTIQTMY
jgi:hypothetical protein